MGLGRRLTPPAQHTGDGVDGHHPRDPFLVGVDGGPRCRSRGGAVEHVVRRRDILRPPLVIADVVDGQLPALVRVDEALGEAPQLLFRRDVEKDLHQRHAVIDQLALELVDLAVGARPFGRRGDALDPLDEDASVPRPVEDRERAGLGQARPETVEVVTALLFGRRGPDRPDAYAARVETLHQASNRTALACRIPALEDDHRAPLLVIVGLLDRQQLELQLLEPPLIVLAIGAGCRPPQPVETDAGHGYPSLRWQAERRPGATSRSVGASTLQRSMACGHRGWK